MKQLFSIILPIYGNEENLPVTVPYIIEHLGLFEKYDVEIIMVCDGSPDNSWEIMKAYHEQYPKLIRIANLSRNYGQTAAIRAGMDLAKGDVIGVISADLQDPFELFADMLKQWEAGSKIVIATRKDREEKGVSVICSKLFHNFIHDHVNKEYPRGGFDFFLLDKIVKDEYVKIDNISPSFQLPLLSLGYKKSFIEYTRTKRKFGKSGYRLIGKLDIAIDSVMSWSAIPLSFVFVTGVIFTVLAFLAGVLDFIFYLSGAANWPMALDILLIAMFFAGILLISAGIIGFYIFKIFKISKKGHRYIIVDRME